MESQVSRNCENFPDFEASLRHFVSRFLCNEQPGSTLLGVISPDASDGRTTVAIGLAKALADVYGSVVLVEMAEGVSIRDELLLPTRPGLRDYLAGVTAGDDLICPTANEKLWFLSAGTLRKPGHTLDVIHRTRTLLDLLRSRFDIVVLDMPPLLRNEEAPALLGTLDCGVLVTSAGVTRMDDLVQTARLCGGLPIRGILLNHFHRMPRWITSLIEP